MVSIILFGIIFAPSSLIQQFISGMGLLTDTDISRETGAETEDAPDKDVEHNDENNIENENKAEEPFESSVNNEMNQTTSHVVNVNFCTSWLDK